MNILAVGIGGFFGAICRYFLSEWIPVNGEFPLATLLVNWIGCFCLAIMLTSVSLKWNPKVKLALTTGFFGAFTTFSTFSLESFQLIQQGTYFIAIVYLLASLFGGLVFSLLGFTLAKGGSKL